MIGPAEGTNTEHIHTKFVLRWDLYSLGGARPVWAVDHAGKGRTESKFGQNFSRSVGDGVAFTWE